MTLDLALRATEILLGWAFLLQSVEHLARPDARIARARTEEQWIFGARSVLALLLISGLAPALTLGALSLTALFFLHRFQGAYNGGSDRMGLLVLFALTAAHWAPTARLQELFFGYLALQLTLSYFISGAVKILQPDWRSGRALTDVFLFSAYPVSGELRRLADRPLLLNAASWAVILFELLFPLALLSSSALPLALAIGALFHLANAFLFGLNRFFWIWLAAYPSLLWLQERLLTVPT